VLASRVGVVGAVLAALVLTVELGVAIEWKHRLAAADVHVVEAVAGDKHALDAVIGDEPNPSDEVILPNRAGY